MKENESLICVKKDVKFQFSLSLYSFMDPQQNVHNL